MKYLPARLRVAAMCLGVLPLASGCATATADQAPVAAARQESAIPFVEAGVSPVAGANRMAVRWAAPGAGRVHVYAGEGSDPVTQGTPIGSGAENGSIEVDAAADGTRRFFTLVPEKGAPLVVADRSLHLPTSPNLRDVGGYRTTDGRWVKMGRIFRSDQLDRLTERDRGLLGAAGVRLVADLRTVSEREREPDRLPDGAEHIVLDVAADSKGSLGGDMKQAFAKIATGKGAEMLTEANRDFVSLDSARASYQTLLNRLAAPSAVPTLYHCTAGKDRTGWASAVILTILGVPRETVMADYLASNVYLEQKNAASVAALARSSTPVPAAYLEPVLTVRASYIEAAFDEVNRRYGSFDAYVRDGLGIDDATVAALRAHYLVGTPQ